MGVGEDESLEESIAVTIIATGFDVEQQDEISNTETKKVVHALEDDHNEIKVKERVPAIITPDVVLKNEVETVTVHTLVEEEDKKDVNMKLIPTTEFLKKLNVVYDEVLDSDNEDDFIITAIAPVKLETPKQIFEEEEQFTFSFDLPLFNRKTEVTQKDENKILFDLDDHTKDMKVNDHIEIIPVTEADENGEKRYALDDFMTYESSINKAKAKQQPVVEDDVVFERKMLSNKEETPSSDEIDPMTSPISDMLKDRADIRRRKMKDFNYKFSSAKVDEIEKEPAYKRQGVNLEENRYSSDIKASRMSVGTDDNDDIQLRSNNSFLHDNVD